MHMIQAQALHFKCTRDAAKRRLPTPFKRVHKVGLRPGAKAPSIRQNENTYQQTSAYLSW